MSEKLKHLLVQQIKDHTYDNRSRARRLKMFSRSVLLTAFGDEPLRDVEFGSHSAPKQRLCPVEAAPSRPPQDEGKEETDHKHERATTHGAKRIRFALGIQEGGSR